MLEFFALGYDSTETEVVAFPHRSTRLGIIPIAHLKTETGLPSYRRAAPRFATRPERSSLVKELLFKLLGGNRTERQLVVTAYDLDIGFFGYLALDQRLG